MEETSQQHCVWADEVSFSEKKGVRWPLGSSLTSTPTMITPQSPFLALPTAQALSQTEPENSGDMTVIPFVHPDMLHVRPHTCILGETLQNTIRPEIGAMLPKFEGSSALSSAPAQALCEVGLQIHQLEAELELATSFICQF